MAETPIRVVCVEDEPEMIDLVRLILSRKGFEVIGRTRRPGGPGDYRADEAQPGLTRSNDAGYGRLGSLSAHEGQPRNERHPSHRRDGKGPGHRQNAWPAYC